MDIDLVGEKKKGITMGKILNKIPTKVEKYFSSVISGIKSQTPNFHVSTAISIFHGRKRPKRLPLSTNGHFLPHRRRHNHRHQESETVANFNRRSAAATLDDIDRYLFENFRSLYEDNGNDEREVEEEMAEFDGAPSWSEIPVPALIDLRGSNRFFITPVSSGSLIEEAVTKSKEAGRKSFNDTALKLNLYANLVENQNGEIPVPALIDLRFFNTPVSSGSLIEEDATKSEDAGCKSINDTALKIKFSANFVENQRGGFAKARSPTLDDCVAVVTVSASPYEDFLQSMVDVTKARAKHERRIDWEFMEELLFSYLRLNEKEHYRFLLRAFVDLVVDLRQSYASGDDGDLSRELVVV